MAVCPLKKNANDYFFIGNIKSDYKKLEKKIEKIEIDIKTSSVVKSDKKLKKPKSMIGFKVLEIGVIIKIKLSMFKYFQKNILRFLINS